MIVSVNSRLNNVVTTMKAYKRFKRDQTCAASLKNTFSNSTQRERDDSSKGVDVPKSRLRLKPRTKGLLWRNRCGLFNRVGVRTTAEYYK